MFCSKCGKEIMDEAVICPNCGCATNNYNQSSSTSINSVYSNDYPIIRKFAEQAQTIKNLGIVAAVLFLGIGIIFSIIIWIKSRDIKIPEITTTNPNEIAEFEEAKRKLNLGNRLAGLPLLGLGIALFICVVIVPFFINNF